MPSGLFNFSKYFKKGDSSVKGQDQPNQLNQTGVSTSGDQQKDSNDGRKESVVSQTSTTSSFTTAKAVPYSGIGSPPAATVKTTAVKTTDIKSQSFSQPATSQALGKSNIDMKKRVGMDVLSRLTQRSSQALMLAADKVKGLKLAYIDTEHVLWALLADSSIYQLISECKAVPSEIQTTLDKGFKKGNFEGTPQFSPRMKRVLELSLSAARSLGYEFISPEHILLALSHEGEGMAARTLAQFNLTPQVLNQKITGRKEIEKEEEKKKTSTLEQFTEDLTAKASRGELDPVVGRSWEIERVIHILSRRTKNNPVLIGDAGVGKTAIVEGLALRIARGDVPETLLRKKILSLDLMSLIAGARHRGEFEERLKNLIKEVKAGSGAIVLFIDELHNMVGAGSGGEGTMDASNILKPSLARGELQAIGTTTVTEYRKYIEKDPALERRFQPILVSEPTIEVAIDMLQALRDRYEAFHRVKISNEAIEAAVRLSQRYVGDRFLPDKAVDLIDEAGASVRLPAISLPEEIKRGEDRLKRLGSEKQEAEKTGNAVRASSLEKEIEEIEHSLKDLKEQYQIKKSTTTNTVTPDIIAEIVSRWTNIPITRLTESESAKLLDMEKIIHKRLIDQEEAVCAIAEAVRRGRAGLQSHKRPIGSFIFMGPTGVGKTELAKTLAEILFGTEDVIVRLDMTEYMEKHEVAKLIGAPPGYVGYEEGGQLTEAVRRHPYSVVLFDEIEKAHLDVFNILIQLLDDGRLTDNKGRTISFKNTIVICTSNLGSGIIQEELLKNGEDQKLKIKDQKQDEIFKTYTISPTGREIITLRERYWEKSPKDLKWKMGKLADYFAGSTIVGEGSSPDKVLTDKERFPIDGFDTHLIASDGSETITKDDKMWFRTSTTSKEWTARSILDQIKGHMVINALPDKPEEQFPTAKVDTHAISPSNVEIVSFGNRFWKRDNLQIKDWTTGLLSEYFISAKLIKNLEPSKKDIGKDQDRSKIAGDQAQKEKRSVSSLINQQRFAKSDAVNTPRGWQAGAQAEAMTPPTVEESEFPTEKWDCHLFKPGGEEIVIVGSRFWRRRSTNVAEWTTGKLEALFPVTVVASTKEEDILPLGKKTEVKKEDKGGKDERFTRLSKRLMEELRKFFRPELLNRFDEVIIFRPLDREHMIEIVALQLKGLSKNLKEQNIATEVSEAAKGYLAEVGFDLVFGARPLRRIIQRLVENPISSMLIKGELSPGDAILVDFDGNRLVFDIKKLKLKKADASVQKKEEQAKSFQCGSCGYQWQVKTEQETPSECPSCKNPMLKEVEAKPSVSQEKETVKKKEEQKAQAIQDSQMPQKPLPLQEETKQGKVETSSAEGQVPSGGQQPESPSLEAYFGPGVDDVNPPSPDPSAS